MRRNLISVSCLDDDGFDCLFDKKQCLITFNDEVVGRSLGITSFIYFPLKISSML
jgi:hypothetical protein